MGEGAGVSETREDRGEMPFLDHVEELRWRILKSLVAVLLASLVGWVIVEHVDVIRMLMRPIIPLLPDGKLKFTSPTEPFLITLKFAFALGLVIASPVVIYQVWAFLTPALYNREKRLIVPALSVGVVLFLTGAAVAYEWLLPRVLRMLFSFQPQVFSPIITADGYFSFAAQFLIAIGLAMELPLVVVILTALRLVTPQFLARHRRYALAVSAVAAALLAPPDALSMLVGIVLLMVLYEVSIWCAWVVTKRRDRREKAGRASAAGLVALLLAAAGTLDAQTPRRPPSPPPRPDTTARTAADSAAQGRLDTATARRLGLPTGPTRSFPPSDAVIDSLLKLRGYRITQYVADTLIAQGGDTETIHLRIAKWIVRGDLAVDSGSTRLYGANSQVTSDENPVPDYHFATGEMKWLNKNVMVARPAVLYIHDVPIMWLPFIFQDVRKGRRSGILVPRFGLNDIVRPVRSYQRHLLNVGYYWAINDYFDFLVKADWYAARYLSLRAASSYKWLDRFIDGSISFERYGQLDSPGSSIRLGWQHQQRFSSRTHFGASIDYASSTRVIQTNTVNPFLATASLTSQVNFTKQFDWGTLSVGGNRSQEVGNGLVSQTIPTVSLAPSPINITPSITWSPGFSFTSPRGPAWGRVGHRVLRQPGHDAELSDSAPHRPLELEQQFRCGGQHQQCAAGSRHRGLDRPRWAPSGAVRPDVQHGDQLANRDQPALVLHGELEAAARHRDREPDVARAVHDPQSVHERAVSPPGQTAAVQRRPQPHFLRVLPGIRAHRPDSPFGLAADQLRLRAGIHGRFGICVRPRSHPSELHRPQRSAADDQPRPVAKLRGQAQAGAGRYRPASGAQDPDPEHQHELAVVQFRAGEAAGSHRLADLGDQQLVRVGLAAGVQPAHVA